MIKKAMPAGRQGFTLVELLVVIAILAIAVTFILTIFTSSLRGSNKSQIVSTIKQNGQSVLETMDKNVRNSDNVVCPSITPPATTASSTNLVVVSKGTYTRYRFIAPSPPVNPTVNGLIQQDNPAKQTVLGIEETDPEFINRVCTLTDPMQGVNILTDTNPQTGVSAVNGLFTRSRQAGSRDSVTIRFDLSPGISAPAVIAGQIDPVTFQTTIQLR